MMKINQPYIPMRTIMTPGPVEVDPRVLRAMGTPILGQFDPAFTNIMNEVMEMLKQVFKTKNRWAFPVDGTSRAGIEAVLASLIEKGDKVLIPIYGRFGHLLTEISERYGAEIHTLECPWGEVFEPKMIIEEIKKNSSENRSNCSWRNLNWMYAAVRGDWEGLPRIRHPSCRRCSSFAWRNKCRCG